MAPGSAAVSLLDRVPLGPTSIRALAGCQEMHQNGRAVEHEDTLWWLSVKPEEHCFRAKGPNWLAFPSYLCSPSFHHVESGPKGQTFGLEHEISMGKRGHKTSHAASYSQSLSRKPRDFLPLTSPKPEKTLARATAACLASV
jgi:hypothetical protein